MAGAARSLAALAGLAALGAGPAPRSVAFLACPVAQDTGPQTDMCFFAEYEGRRYALTNPNDFGNPQLGHRVLVEAVVTNEPARCGGIVLDGRVSVMTELSPECDRIEPFAGETAGQIRAGTAEQAQHRREELDAIARDPARSLLPHRLSAPAPVSVALGHPVIVYYPFDSDRSSGPDAERMVQLAALAQKTPGAGVHIRAARGATLLDSGEVLAERSDMATRRADKVAAILVGLGVPADRVRAEPVDKPRTPTGREDWASRFVEITVTGRQGPESS